MAINSKYNGWPAKVRKIRGKAFYAQMYAGKIPKPTVCECCGVEGIPMTYHAEEYGPTWEEYVDGAKSVCAMCHGMIHLRFKFPNRWNRFKTRIRDKHDFYVFSHLGEFFTHAKKLPDIDYVPPQKSGVEWVDNLSTKPYSGPDHVALAVDADGDYIPDPKIYSEEESQQIMEMANESPD